MELSKRLYACAKYTDGFNKLADIGTDHAFLPIHCVREGYVASALAIDNKEGPFVIAFSNVKKNDLQDKITVIKGDGIEKIDDSTDVVVISGMGGGLIRDIIKTHSTRNVKRLILQPNNSPEKVRKALVDISFHIVDELVLKEKNKFYDIIVAEPGLESYTDFELLFGPINLQHKPHYFTERNNKEIDKLLRFIEKIPTDQQKESLLKQVELLKEANQ